MSYAGDVAAEIDRLVIGGHEVADAYPDKPASVQRLSAHPALFNTVAVLLLAQSLRREDVSTIIAYTPPQLVTALIDNNVAEGVVVDDGGRISLTDNGRAPAEGVVAVQEAAVTDLWAGADEQLDTVRMLTQPLVERGRNISPPADPSAFGFFAAVCNRPTVAGTVLRQITALRYWRADAHRRAVLAAGLTHAEAHALNVLWDRHRGRSRVGQGFPEPGTKATTSLEARGYATSGTITDAGVQLREAIECDTDERTAPVYEDMDDDSGGRLLGALRALPG